MAKPTTTPSDESAGGRTTVSDLFPDPRNARAHSERNLELIAQSLTELGAARSIVVDEAGTILAGNATVQAAQQAGLIGVRVIDADGSELIAVRRSGLSPEQKRRLALFDNRTAELASWDTDILASLTEDTDLAALWEADELHELLGESDESVLLADPEQVPEFPADPVTQPGDLWLLGPHRLLCGDSTKAPDVARLMNGQRTVLMATDPPYLVNYQGGNHPQSWHNTPAVKDKHWDDYVEGDGLSFYTGYLRTALTEALIANPAIYQWYATARHVLVEQAWREVGLLPHQQLVWVKARAVLTHSHYMWQHEPCLYGWVQGKPPSRKPPANATTIWAIDQVGESDGIHPTQKPTETVLRPITYHTLPGELLNEPFAGSGTAFVAAERTGRVCYGLELAPAYCDVIVERWQTLTGQTATREAATTPVRDAA